MVIIGCRLLTWKPNETEASEGKKGHAVPFRDLRFLVKSVTNGILQIPIASENAAKDRIETDFEDLYLSL